MKFLFLDIDGVLCTERSHFAIEPQPGGLMVALDPVGVQLLNRICERTTAKIVISSSWRTIYGVHETQCHLRAAGLHMRHLNKANPATPSNAGLTSRGTEIKAFLEKNHCHAYCILDDDPDFLEEQKPFHVHTHYADGIMWDH